jgi:hypothetical protein
VISLHKDPVAFGKIVGKTKKVFSAIEFTYGPDKKPVKIGAAQLETIAKIG